MNHESPIPSANTRPGSHGNRRSLGNAPAALRHGVQFPDKVFGLHEMARNGHRLTLLGRERIDGIDYYALELTLSDGFVTRYYMDPTSWLLTRGREERALHPDIDPVKRTIEARNADYRKVGGLLYAFAATEVDLSTGQTLQTATTMEIRLNPDLPDGLFQRP